jgi:hypothetical protein
VDMIYYILASIVAVIVGFIVVKKLKNKGYLSDENIQNVKQTLSIIDFLIQKVSNNDFSTPAKQPLLMCSSKKLLNMLNK